MTCSLTLAPLTPGTHSLQTCVLLPQICHSSFCPKPGI